MTDLPIPANDGVNVPTVEQQERIAAARRAAGQVALSDLPIDEETAKLIGLQPECRRDDPEAILKAASATRFRNSRIWKCSARGVALDADGKEIPQDG